MFITKLITFVYELKVIYIMYNILSFYIIRKLLDNTYIELTALLNSKSIITSRNYMFVIFHLVVYMHWFNVHRK